MSQRPREWAQPVFALHVGGDSIGRSLQVVESGANCSANQLLRQALRKAVDGGYSCEVAGLGGGLHELPLRGCNLIAPGTLLDLAIDDYLAPMPLERVLYPALIEPNQADCGGAIGDSCAYDNKVALPVLAIEANNAPLQSDPVAGLQAADGAEIRPVLVPERQVVDKVLYRFYSKLGKYFRGLRPHAFDKLNRGFEAASRGRRHRAIDGLPAKFALTLIFLCFGNACAQVKTIRDVTYGTFKDLEGNRQELKMDLYLPRQQLENTLGMPAIVWLHPGGWSEGSRFPIPPQVQDINYLGYAVISVDYRLSSQGKWPGQLYDCKGAIRFLRAHAQEYGINPNAIGVWGYSAGGHLAALLGTTSGLRTMEIGGQEVDAEGSVGGNLQYPSRVQAVCDWFGPSDIRRLNDFINESVVDYDEEFGIASALVGGLVQESPAAPSTDPGRYASPGDPPFLIMHGTEDTWVPLNQSEILNAELAQAGVTSTLYPVFGGDHGAGAFGDWMKKWMVWVFFGKHLAYTRDQSPVAIATLNNGVFDGSQSYDPDGGISEYLWDFGDGGTATGPTATHVYSRTGSFTATLTVRDFYGNLTSTTLPCDNGSGFRLNTDQRRVAGFSRYLYFTIFRDDAGSAASVHVATEEGTAIEWVDYVPLSADIQFLPGEKSKLVRIDLVPGTAVNRTMSVRLSAPQGGPLGSPALAQCVLRYSP